MVFMLFGETDYSKYQPGRKQTLDCELCWSPQIVLSLKIPECQP